jgi:DNA polymerase III delta prime subunit
MNPIICIGNYYVDKKIKELIKVCNVFELKSPTRMQMSTILDKFIKEDHIIEYKEKILDYIQGDMRKLIFIQELYKTKSHLLTKDTLENIFQIKSFNEDSKKITASLINYPVSLQDQQIIMNDTDRTIVSLLWHENIADALSPIKCAKSFPFYVSILDNICFADYIDRITFQNQIWLFNEMSSLIKTFYNNRLYHTTFPENRGKFKNTEIRFTKVLTKYSTEYNNSLFIYNMSQQLNMDKKDLIACFQELRMQFENNNTQTAENMLQIENIFENYNITKLDVRRMYRFLDKNIKKEAVITMEDCDED